MFGRPVPPEQMARDALTAMPQAERAALATRILMEISDPALWIELMRAKHLIDHRANQLARITFDEESG